MAGGTTPPTCDQSKPNGMQGSHLSAPEATRVFALINIAATPNIDLGAVAQEVEGLYAQLQSGEIQAFDGGRWRKFGTARARPGGRYRARYRFTRGARPKVEAPKKK